MTTTSVNANVGNPILNQKLKPTGILTVGVGHVNPSKASTPGLMYDIVHLCGLGYSNRQVNAIAWHAQINCKSIQRKLNSNLNYSSFMVTLGQTNSYNVTAWRTVTNVGAPSSAYTVQVEHPKGVAVRVKLIEEDRVLEEQEEDAVFSGRGNPRRTSSNPQGQLTWVSSDKSITVNSPIQLMLS